MNARGAPNYRYINSFTAARRARRRLLWLGLAVGAMSMDHEDAAKFDPLSLMVPGAMPRWREKQKTLASHIEESVPRDEKTAIRVALELVGDPPHGYVGEDPEVRARSAAMPDEEKHALLSAAVAASAALGIASSEVPAYWHDRGVATRDLLGRQLAERQGCRDAMAKMSKFKLRRALERSHEQQLSSGSCKEVAEAKHMLRLMQKADGDKPLYESDEDVPAQSEEEKILYRLTYHEAVLPPPEPRALPPLRERQATLKLELGAAGVEAPRLPLNELLALTELRDGCGAAEWADRRGWEGPALVQAPHEAFGVTVFFPPDAHEGSVHELQLPGNGLRGALPASIGYLTNLRVLRLGRNQLGGLLPEELGECRSCESIDLSSNAFYGTLPAALGRCLQLNTLIANHNRFSGRVPSTLCECRNLNVSFALARAVRLPPPLLPLPLRARIVALTPRLPAAAAPPCAAARLTPKLLPRTGHGAQVQHAVEGGHRGSVHDAEGALRQADLHAILIWWWLPGGQRAIGACRGRRGISAGVALVAPGRVQLPADNLHSSFTFTARSD